MKLAALVVGLGVSISVVVTTANHADAQNPAVRYLIFYATAAAMTAWGISAANAQRNEPGGSSTTSPRTPLPAPDGIVYKLGPGWEAVTSAQYCVSFVSGFCTPSDKNGKVFSVEVIDIKSATVVGR